MTERELLRECRDVLLSLIVTTESDWETHSNPYPCAKERELLARIDAHLAALQSLDDREDAARYWWLRETDYLSVEDAARSLGPQMNWPTREEHAEHYDRKIDAARKEKA